MKILTICTIVFTTLQIVYSYKILIAAPVVTKHLNNVLCGISKGLVIKGNHVTMISPHPPNFSHENFTIYKLSEIKPLLNNFDQFKSNSSLLKKHVLNNMKIVSKVMWEGFTIKDLLEIKDTYQAVITPTFLSELAYPFLVNYSGVYIDVFSPGMEQFVVSQREDDSIYTVNPSLDAPYFGSYTVREKFLYSLSVLNELEVSNTGILPGTDRIVTEYRNDVGNLEKYQARSCLTLLDGHFALDGLNPLLPRQIEIGTIIAKKSTPLSKELDIMIRSTKGKGIVYVSFGSHLRSEFIPQGFKDTILKAFEHLPYKIVWQYDGMDLRKVDNVLLKKTLPQQDILGHPSTLVMVSHCSLPATQEAAYHGVPVLAIPVSMDQHRNADKLVRHGMAIILNWRTVAVDNIVESLATLIREPYYRQHAGNLSRIIRDQKEAPSERAAWWVEYAIRHKETQLTVPHHHSNAATNRMSAVCDEELIKMWSALTLFLGGVCGACLAMCCRAVSDCVNYRKCKKNKSE